MLEYEKKIILTESEYLSVVKLMCEYKPIQIQTNYYFDNDDLSMNKQGITCRIRSKDGKYKTTVKKHNVEHPDCSIEVDLGEKEEFDSQIFNLFGLHNQGELVTYRIVVYEDSACEMVIDKNVYLGHTDFELEVEYCAGNEHKAQSLIVSIAHCLVAAGQLNVTHEFLSRVGQAKSKSQRFFEHFEIRR